MVQGKDPGLVDADLQGIGRSATSALKSLQVADTGKTNNSETSKITILGQNLLAFGWLHFVAASKFSCVATFKTLVSV